MKKEWIGPDKIYYIPGILDMVVDAAMEKMKSKSFLKSWDIEPKHIKSINMTSKNSFTQNITITFINSDAINFEIKTANIRSKI
jgi:hypothetical protein